MQEEINSLKRQVTELIRWKEEKTRQQISFPIDVNSISNLAQHFFKKFIYELTNQGITSLSLKKTTIGGIEIPSATNRRFLAFMSAGPETVDNQGSAESSSNSQIYLEDQQDSATLDSFFYGYRKPLHVPKTGLTFTVTSAGTTLTDSSKAWTTNELSGANVNIYNSSGVFQFSRQIASNTATVITIDGTWPATVSGGTYLVYMPLYLGSAGNPFRQVYAGGTDVSSGGDGSVRRAIRLGYGTSGGTETIGIFFGTSTPESVVTANVGSLFLRTDGGATTTLYVKTSGTGNTGWTAK